jgi:hypothetical protein
VPVWSHLTDTHVAKCALAVPQNARRPVDMWTTQGRCPHPHRLNSRSNSQLQFNENELDATPAAAPPVCPATFVMKSLRHFYTDSENHSHRVPEVGQGLCPQSQHPHCREERAQGGLRAAVAAQNGPQEGLWCAHGTGAILSGDRAEVPTNDPNRRILAARRASSPTLTSTSAMKFSGPSSCAWQRSSPSRRRTSSMAQLHRAGAHRAKIAFRKNDNAFSRSTTLKPCRRPQTS